MSYSPNANYKAYPIRATTALTNAYVAATVLGVEDINLTNNNQLILLVNLVLDTLTTAEVKIEYSADGITYYQDTVESVNLGTGIATEVFIVRQFGASGHYRIAVPIMDQFIKVSVQGTGAVGVATMAVTALVGNV